MNKYAEKQRTDVDLVSKERYLTNTMPKVVSLTDSIGIIINCKKIVINYIL